jgi:hypothetical protein
MVFPIHKKHNSLTGVHLPHPALASRTRSGFSISFGCRIQAYRSHQRAAEPRAEGHIVDRSGNRVGFLDRISFRAPHAMSGRAIAGAVELPSGDE